MSDFKAKMHKIRFPLWFCPRSCWWSLQCSPDLLAVFKGPTSKGKVRGGNGRGGEGEKKGTGREEGEEGTGGEWREVRGQPLKYFGLEPPLLGRALG